GTAEIKRELAEKGFSSKEIEKLAYARIFGPKPGQFSTKILYLVPKSGAWENEEEITEVYMENMSFVYTKGIWGEKIKGLYETTLKGTEMVIRTWSSNMTSPLSNHHAYEYLGGLSMAVRKVTGREAEALIADVRDPSNSRMRDFNEVIRTELRVRFLNEKWIKGMMKSGYAGAGQMAALAENTFGWRVTRPSSIQEEVWKEIYEVYVKDKYNLGLREWFEQLNPYAFQDIAAVPLESARKGYWKPSEEVLRELSREFARSVAKHGISEGLTTGGNRKLERYVKKRLEAPGDKVVLAGFKASIERTSGVKMTPVSGVKLEKKGAEQPERGEEVKKPERRPLVLVPLLLLIAFLLGFITHHLRRRGRDEGVD
ncbi:TPA: cobaltochelatase subunit CobN, partial [Candidatus Poribacteria bacterium]|nr:cobaltochelatase subunit CobN [Candidatus Poribacteria bacterium]